MEWHCKSWQALSTDELYGLLELRAKVFVVEQACPYLDPDGLDRQVLHVFAKNTEGKIQACARIVPAGINYPEASIGRVCCAQSVRSKGLGRALMDRVMQYILLHYGEVPLRISAQEYLVPFYTAYGFESVGEAYLDEGILHVEMYRS